MVVEVGFKLAELEHVKIKVNENGVKNHTSKEGDYSSYAEEVEARDKETGDRSKIVNLGRFQALQNMEEGEVHEVEDSKEVMRVGTKQMKLRM